VIALKVFVLFSLAHASLSTALRPLSAPPIYPAGVFSPSLYAIGDNLVKRYGDEISEVTRGIALGTKLKERKRLIFEMQQRRNGETKAAIDKSTPAAVNQIIIEKVFTTLVAHPVARVDAVTKYDKRGDVGFCFGRAMLVHSLLLKEGVRPEQIAKIFAVGKLLYKKQLWDFHMATLVRGEGTWWVVDSLFDKILPHAEWMRRVALFGINREHPEARFFVTDPRKFQPAYAAYRAYDLREPELEEYFNALFQ